MSLFALFRPTRAVGTHLVSRVCSKTVRPGARYFADMPANLNITDAHAIELVNAPPPPPKPSLVDGDLMEELSSVIKAVDMLEAYDVEREDLVLPEHLIQEGELHSSLEVGTFNNNGEEVVGSGEPLPFWPSLETGMVRKDLLHRVFVHQRNKARGKRTAKVRRK